MRLVLGTDPAAFTVDMGHEDSAQVATLRWEAARQKGLMGVHTAKLSACGRWQLGSDAHQLSFSAWSSVSVPSHQLPAGLVSARWGHPPIFCEGGVTWGFSLLLWKL